MVAFIYRKVVKGKGALLPKLELEVERCFPNHQQFISEVLGRYGMSDWEVFFHPYRRKPTGLIAVPMRLIIINYHRRKEMTITLYHEIIHYLNMDWRDKERKINRMAAHWYVTGKCPTLIKKGLDK